MAPEQGNQVGMLSDIVSEDFYDILRRGSKLILANDYVRILAHYDGDGTSAAIILATALERKGIKYHLGYIKSLDGENFRKRLEEEKDVFTIIVDAGSDQAQYISDFENVVILDHHFFTKSTISCLNINARDYGVNGTREACGATMAYLMALSIDEGNQDLLPFFLSGVIADKQDIGGLEGLNKEIMSEYGKDAKKSRLLNLEGQDLLDSITYSTDPFFLNLSGYPENVKKFLQELGIDPAKKFTDITEDQRMALAEKLAMKMLSKKVGSEALKYLEADIVSFDNIEFTSKEISSIVDGNSKMGMNSLSVQYFLGDASVKDDLLSNWKMFKTKLIDYIYRSMKELYEEKNVRYFYAPESEMAGSISGIMMLYLLDQAKPLVGFSVSLENKSTKVSGRGTRRMVSRGLNLSTVMKECAKEVGGSGGGHDIAAGAVIPKGSEKEFISLVDRFVAGQLSGSDPSIEKNI